MNAESLNQVDGAVPEVLGFVIALDDSLPQPISITTCEDQKFTGRIKKRGIKKGGRSTFQVVASYER